MSVTDVLVVGGGPAGSSLAGLLAQRGHRVVLVDRSRFPRPKPCGEFVNPGAIRTLERLGLAEPVRALRPAELTGWQLMDSAGSVSHANLGVDTIGWGVDRGRLDAALLSTARDRGVEVVEGVRVEQVERGDSRSRLIVGRRDGHSWEHRARLVVGADGLRSVVARRLGALGRGPRLRKFSITCHIARPEGDLPEGRGVLWMGDRTTVGLAPLSADGSQFNLTVVGDPNRDGGSASHDLSGFFIRTARLSGLFTQDPLIIAGPWTSGPFDWPVARPTGPGYLLVGDASGYYDPLTGQGIYRALRSAELGAAAADRWLSGERSQAGGVPNYARALRVAFRPGRGVQRLVEETLGRERVRRRVFRRLANSPRSADALVRVTGDALPVRTLLAPAVWAPLLFRTARRDRPKT